MAKGKLAPLTPKVIKAGRRVNREIAAGKSWDSIKGLRKVDLRLYRTAEVSKATREREGLTQAELARALGVSTETVRAWEQNKKKPRGLVEKVFKLIAADPKLLERFAAS